MNPFQTAPRGSLILVHIICNICYLRTLVVERADNKRCNGKASQLEMCPGDRDAPTVAKFAYSQKIDNDIVL